MIPRGGFQVTTTLAAKAASAFLAINGGMLLVKNPKKPAKDDPEESQLATTLMRARGSFSIGAAVMVCSSVVQHVDLPTAVGLGLLPRILCFLWILLCYRRTKFLVVNTLLTSWCAYNILLREPSKALLTWKLFSLMSVLKGTWLVVAPATAIARILSLDKPVGVGTTTQALSKGLGNEVIASAILMGSLALDVHPAQASGFAFLAWIILLADTTFRDPSWKSMDDQPKTPYVHMMISAIFAFGLLFGRQES
jgi:hypothetical protein